MQTAWSSQFGFEFPDCYTKKGNMINYMVYTFHDEGWIEKERALHMRLHGALHFQIESKPGHIKLKNEKRNRSDLKNIRHFM